MEVSSGEKIASNEDLSTEILLRLPIQSILRSKCVSKFWLSLITNPRFSLLRQPHSNSPSGLFLESWPKREYAFVPLDPENPVKPPFKTLSFYKGAPASGITILHSVNGFMLCYSNFFRKHYVYNPTVNQFTTLPDFDGRRISTSCCGMSLVFDPLISPHFRVVCVRDAHNYYQTNLFNNGYYQIDVYSSATGKWRVSGEPFRYELEHLTKLTGGVYWNDSIHWINDSASWITYFKLDKERIGYIKACRGVSIRNRLFQSQDSLLLIEVFNYPFQQFDVLEMRRDYSGWLLKYKVNLVNVSKVFPEIIDLFRYLFAVCCVVLGEKEEDSFVVVEIHGKAIRYNLKLNTCYKLCDVTNGLSIYNLDRRVFLFTQTLSAVSH